MFPFFCTHLYHFRLELSINYIPHIIVSIHHMHIIHPHEAHFVGHQNNNFYSEWIIWIHSGRIFIFWWCWLADEVPFIRTRGYNIPNASLPSSTSSTTSSICSHKLFNHSSILQWISSSAISSSNNACAPSSTDMTTRECNHVVNMQS